jgi:hypothetical protein
MGIKKVFNCEAYAQKHAELTGMYIEEVNGKYIVFTKQPSVDTTADITVLYEEVEERPAAPKKVKKKKTNN